MNVAIWLLVVFVECSQVLGADGDSKDWLKKCPDCCFLPKKFKNGKISPRFDENTLFVQKHTILTFQCRPKYLLSGERINICLNGKWLPKIPKCIFKSCPPPPLLDHGEAVLHSNSGYFPEKTRIRYKCDEGYELSERNELICTVTESRLEWKGKLPTCIAVKSCRDPGVSANGYRVGECCNDGNVLRYGCDPGFTLVGVKEIVCNNEVWSNSRPLCRPEDFCPDPPFISKGRILGEKTSDFYQNGDEINIECERGYSVSDGSDFLYCEDGEWDEEFPSCTEIRCNLPTIPENGFIHEKHQSYFPFEFELNFGCREGYLLKGSSWTACTDLGWSYHSPTCKKIRCPIPSVPESGWKKGDSNEIGDVVEFGCFSGYQLLGSSIRECLTNGKWGGELSRCDSKVNDCPNPGIPINGIKIGRSYKFGNVVEFGCQPGTQLIGSQQRMCQQDGDWSGIEAICLDEEDFDQKESISSRLQEIITAEKTEQEDILEDYRKNLANDSHVLSRAIDLNHPNRLVFYFIFDSSGSIGKEDFGESVKFVKLLIQKIGVSKDGSRVGVMTFTHEAKVEFYPVDYITTDEVIDALDNIKYKTEGGTAIRLALKQLTEQMLPLTEDRLGGKQKPILFLLTDGKANMEGNPMQDATKLKNYGVEIYCIAITGDRNMNTLYDIASTKDEHVFILDSYDTIEWLVQEIINGTVDYSVNCGIQKTVITEVVASEDDLGRVIGGKQAIRPWPWMAALFFADSQDQDLTKARLRCGGSVLHKVWILTAAHCLYDENGILVDKKNMIVKLGLLNVRNHSNLQQLPVEKYIIHDEYVRKTHHNDIALVKLSREAEFNTFVRPICLPPSYSMLPKNSKFYRESERAIAIGWGYDKAVKFGNRAGNPVDQLKRINLPIQNEITCRNSLNNKNYHFTDAMFCAGSGKRNEDTCKGDSGGPLMQWQLNNLGQKYWTQVGIISWGVGCGQKGNYGFYTYVAKLKEWIEETKQKE